MPWNKQSLIALGCTLTSRLSPATCGEKFMAVFSRPDEPDAIGYGSTFDLAVDQATEQAIKLGWFK